MDVTDEFIDRFGDIPPSVQGLIDVALLRAYAAKLGIFEIKQQNGMVLAFFNELKPEYVSAVAVNLRGKAMISGAKSSAPYISLKLQGRSNVDAIKELVTVLSAVEG